MLAHAQPRSFLPWPLLLHNPDDKKADNGTLTLGYVCQLHARLVVSGLARDVSLTGKILSLCCSVQEADAFGYARLFFERSHRRNSFMWNTLIRYADDPDESLSLFSRMLSEADASPDRFTFPCLLKACSRLGALPEGRQIHSHVVKNDHCAGDGFVLNTLLNLYAACGRVEDARRIFNGLPKPRDVVSWNALLGKEDEPIRFFVKMLTEAEVVPDAFTFSLLFRSECPVREGMQIHGYVSKGPLINDVFVCNAIMHMYCSSYRVDAARQIFDSMLGRDEVSWNTIIDGFVKNGITDVARELFDEMPERSRGLIAWNTMISGYAKSGDMDIARQLFDESPNRDSVSWNTMIDGYVKCGQVEAAQELFDRMPWRNPVSWSLMICGYARVGRMDHARTMFDEMPHRDVVAWNVLISGYVDNGMYKEAVEVFHEMKTCGVVPDRATLAPTLSAIACLGSLDEGRDIHNYIDRNSMPLDGILGAAVVDMYAKCGAVADAVKVFEMLPKKGLDHWNAMIGGLAMHGHAEAAIHHFSEMKKQGFEPNDITFIAVLSACSHAGMVSEGRMYFEQMNSIHSIAPKVQHYGCMVDILGRAGLLQEALELVENMPMEPNAVVWRSLLGACRSRKNLAIGALAAGRLIELDPHDSSIYILLSNLYASAGMWDDASRVRKMMRVKEIRKVPGCSSIQVEGRVCSFLVGDRTNPRSEEMYFLLEDMNMKSRSTGYITDSVENIFGDDNQQIL